MTGREALPGSAHRRFKRNHLGVPGAPWRHASVDLVRPRVLQAFLGRAIEGVDQMREIRPLVSVTVSAAAWSAWSWSPAVPPLAFATISSLAPPQVQTRAGSHCPPWAPPTRSPSTASSAPSIRASAPPKPQRHPLVNDLPDLWITRWTTGGFHPLFRVQPVDKPWTRIQRVPEQFFSCKQMSKERPWLSEALRHIPPRIERTQKSSGTLRTPAYNGLSSLLVRWHPSRCSPSPVEAKVWARVEKARCTLHRLVTTCGKAPTPIDDAALG